MPAIRGSSFNYETTTTDAGIVVPICTNSAGDLLITTAMADSSAGVLGTFTATPPTNWKILDEMYSTCPTIAYMKIATGSDVDCTLTATTVAATSESYNGSMVSIRDVDPITPVGTSVISTYTTQNSDQAVGNGTTTGVAQSYTTPAATASINGRGCFARVKLYLKKSGSPTGNAVVKIYAHSGTLGTTSIPTGAALATSTNFNVSTLTTSYQVISFVFAESNWFQFVAATNYVVALEYSAGNASNFIQAGYNSSSGHAGNKSTFAAAVWSAQATHDLYHIVERFSFNFSALSGLARTTFPTITTEQNNSLVLYYGNSTGSAGTPSFLEGPVYSLLSVDGLAESHGIGWTFQQTAGTTPANIVLSESVTGAGVNGLLQVNPPTTGATVLPAYVIADSCQYVDPISGTSAFNGGTALAATADTNFGTTNLGGSGFTANDATVAAMTDVGINSFHSLGGLTNATTAGQISGAEVIPAAANRPNITGKNLLCHVYAASPAHMQRFSSTASGRGFWMGVRSNTGAGGATTGFKIWQVHGVDAPWDYGMHVPIIINPSATNTKGTSGTLDSGVIASIGFWNSANGTLTCQMGVGSLWVMSTTTVCGGNAAEPIDIEQIVSVIARGKERVSAIRQGSKQMLLLQDLQLGNGGTNATYLDLVETAIEFPRQYNAATREVNYNSTDNIIGLKYYPGSSDTIKHRNSIISSKSRYFWGIHASASTSASYDFSGLSVIGAGTITLAKAITITELTINNYSTIDATGLTLTNSTITTVPNTNASITLSAGSNIDYCTVNTTGLTTAGNYWTTVADPSIFSYSAFTGSASTGHAIRITTPGSYTLDGNTFTGYGGSTGSNLVASSGSTSAAIFNDSGGSVTLTIQNGGSNVSVRNGTSASTTVVIGAVVVTLTATTIAGSPIENANVMIAANTGGPMPYDVTVTISNSGTTATVSHTTHGLETNDKVKIKGASHYQNNGVFTITKIDANSYSYTMPSAPGSNPTGTIKATFVFLFGLTNASGIITMSRVVASSQPVLGWVRRSSGSPYYKEAPVTGTVSNTTGVSISALLISDE